MSATLCITAAISRTFLHFRFPEFFKIDISGQKQVSFFLTKIATSLVCIVRFKELFYGNEQSQ